MARIFKVETIRVGNVYVLSGDFDPSSIGQSAPLGSLFIAEGGSLYTKTTSADNGWSIVAGGGGGGQPLDATLTALAALNSTAGLLEQTGADTFTKRTIGVAASTSIPTRADADGRYQAADDTLTALAGIDTTAGLVEQTAADTFTKRAIGVAASTSILTRADGDTRYQAASYSEWTYVKLDNDFNNSLTTPSLSNLKFTPSGSKQYEVMGFLLLKSAASATGVRPGFQFPTGLSAVGSGGGGIIRGPGATTTSEFPIHAQPGSTLVTNATSHPSNSGYYPADLYATVITGVTPSGDFGITVESELSGSQVTIGAGSFIRYREI